MCMKILETLCSAKGQKTQNNRLLVKEGEKKETLLHTKWLLGCLKTTCY